MDHTLEAMLRDLRLTPADFDLRLRVAQALRNSDEWEAANALMLEPPYVHLPEEYDAKRWRNMYFPERANPDTPGVKEIYACPLPCDLAFTLRYTTGFPRDDPPYVLKLEFDGHLSSFQEMCRVSSLALALKEVVCNVFGFDGEDGDHDRIYNHLEIAWCPQYHPSTVHQYNQLASYFADNIVLPED